MISWLNQNSGAIQAISTTVLVAITGFYAWQTYKTNKLITRQLLSDIELKIKTFKSSLLDQEFLENISRNIETKSESMYNIRFNLIYSVKNKSAGYGSIEKPTLIICSKNMKVLQRIPVNNGKIGMNVYGNCNSPSEILAIKRLSEAEQEYSNTIYMKPGEKKILEEDYCIFVVCKKPSINVNGIITQKNDLIYGLEYVNENEKTIKIEIDNELIEKI